MDYNDYNAEERRKELLPFVTAWMEMESIMLSEISLAVTDEYQPYDLKFKWNLINKTKKQAKYNRDIEIKNNLTVTRGEVAGDNWGKRGRIVKEHV